MRDTTQANLKRIAKTIGIKTTGLKKHQIVAKLADWYSVGGDSLALYMFPTSIADRDAIRQCYRAEEIRIKGFEEFYAGFAR